MSLNIAVVGTGFMGQLHARTVRDSPAATLQAVVDVNEAVGRPVAEELGTNYHSSVSAALEDSAIDAYIVALPDTLHEEASVEILRAGKPVLLEKPLAHTLEVARRIAAAADQGGARLLVGQLLRHDPRYAAAAAAVREGKVGEPLHLTAGRIASRDVGTRMNGKSSVLFYVGIHDVDAIQWITGQRITRVYSRAVSKLMPSMGVESEDAILSVVDLENGGVGELFNGWTRTSDTPVQIDGRFELFGTDGSLEVDVRDHGIKVYGKDSFEVPDALHWPEVNGRMHGDLAAEVAHFVEAVVHNKPFVISVEEAMRDVAVNDAILRSVESGQPEDVEVV
ncbi:Gfo/Idh/MocA family oxidoreductase (plasmid) [Arthrobacter sp. zg-Y820]|uniref:Gfo/Idh/MocA family protein n=1 Tax=unclassified Arthrobacter TaxID=235627 RepID=UPI001E3C53C0|nr:MULTISPECIES: Gfo/Idh/MocA family oxidoreductase [unclassified Arthrobacter]MCC9198516.1 Gfo/Idh/MocA family oxidoreductase [Arthrobacter sp. zg-Y820]MDK1281386.1 Gfo/Idh/MocA family oxidoreductase [Arthrobacter sp. zg.Y820]WIB11267.1 Gfo/Idh/MocA family oxidoreductase [Arthrobacter sp. zg-Y820]